MRRLLLALLLVPFAAPAHAESWCAYPLWVHEWGVHVFAADGKPAAVEELPDYFHPPAGGARSDAQKAVRNLPADSGVRALPVLHFYSSGSLSSPIPVAVEVGFTHGAASAWYPAVDRLRPADEANGPEAAAMRAKIEKLRAARKAAGPFGRDGELAPIPLDTTRQLAWVRIDLTPKPVRTPASTGEDWVQLARKFSALWANSDGESERFVFYEAGTDERVPLMLVRGDTFGKGRRHYVLHNTSGHAVHDVFVVTREKAKSYVFYAPAIPAGKSAGFLIEDHLVKDVEDATVGRLRRALVDPAATEAPKDYRWGDGCVMGRDPALPFEEAASHKLFASEVDLILEVWGARFFEQQGTTIVYREDTEALDAAMPLSIYTDMYNFVVLHRAGLAVWEHVKLP